MKPFILSSGQKITTFERLREMIEGFPEIAFAYVHGSILDDLPFHDLDIGIYLTGEEAMEPTTKALDTGQILSRELKIPVDVKALNQAPVPFRYQVAKGYLLFCRDEELLSRFLEDTISRYLDMKPLRRKAIKEAFA
ncbi:MAG: nucleotidyltransferase domain-containing protein [Dissulfuribacterales bacterium]